MKTALLIVATTLWLGLFSFAEAQTGYAILIGSQDNFGASTTSAYNATAQGLGTGYIGTLTRVEWKMRGSFTGAGTALFHVLLDECDDAAYVTCTNVGQTQDATVSWSTGISTKDYAAQMVSSWRMSSSKYYKLRYAYGGGGGTGNVYLEGTDSPSYQHGSGQSLQSGSGVVSTYYQLIGEFDSSGVSIAAATSSSIFSGQDATSTLSDLAQQCSQAGNIFAEGLCVAFSYLFVPSPEIIGGYAALPDELSARFPVSYVAGLSDLVTGLQASSTSNMITLSLPFHSLGIGSTSPLGLANVVSTDVDAFSTSTITQYIGSSNWAVFQMLMSAAIWLLLVYDIFYTVRNRMWGTAGV